MGVKYIEYLFPYVVQDEIAPPAVHTDTVTEFVTEPI